MEDGISVVLVTHHINEIPPAIERIVMLRGGAIVADGPKREILTAENLSELYGTSLRIIEADGYFMPLP